MRRALLACLLAVAACAAPAGPQAAGTPVNAERFFRSCPGANTIGKAVNLSWQRPAGAIDEHRSLRTRLGLAFPEAGERILLYSSAVHHTSVQFSVVALRGAAGVWHVDEAGEEGPGLLRIAPSPLPHKSYDLTADQSRQVDSLLEDPCLYASPTFQRNPDIVAGGAFQTLDIVTARRRATLTWLGLRTPQEERLVKLIARD